MKKSMSAFRLLSNALLNPLFYHVSNNKLNGCGPKKKTSECTIVVELHEPSSEGLYRAIIFSNLFFHNIILSLTHAVHFRHI